ncbi:MucBP domain-containing protein [Lactococcus petauri]|uniref:MucBP domain-containing protein n=1 Tax=Lactococcus petauri TaxID=1940789 RepID=A0AAJ2IZJ6_9LACT|nr:MucBP domain-containing protein [Lactococcus petauri]MDT2527301.1 MucBP domain-containing protein [Lactococcus petauri]MDT2542036.1 MucBP domain-containing protein [Lactococcus petauri]MDT2558635.1 MucBP domain-containing protein [Lactococcus petauri]MDT2560744.1 MucBP domain-containing protein [Lactococcus petauri]MDT2569126.1 MucBP domain-containing protein [Lactococcus petauri]
MKNTKNTRVQKQQKKAKKQRRISSTLMCGLVLSGVALPAVAVLADNAIQSQTPASTQSSTVKTAQDTPAQSSEAKAPAQSSNAVKTPAQSSEAKAPAQSSEAVKTPTTASEAVKTTQDTPAPQDKSAQGTITVNVINEKDGSVIKSHTFTGAVGSKLTWGQIFETIDTTGWSSTGHQDIDGADGQMGYLLFKDNPRTVNPTFISNNPDDQKTNISMKLNFVEFKTGKVLKAPYTSTIVGYPNSGIDLAGLVESGMPDPNIAGYDLVDEDGDVITINNSGVYEYGSGGSNIPEHNVYYKEHKEKPVENVTFKTRYVDDATGKDIAPSSSDTLPVGSSYSATALDIPHYKLNSAKDVNFTVQKGQEDVIFHYTKDQESFVEFKLVDAKTNKEIGKSVKRSGQEGQWTSIDPSSKEFKIDGYTMQKSYYQTPGLGTQTYDFPEPGKTNSVTVKYDKDSDKPVAKEGTLTIRYTDTRGNEIKDPTTQEGKVGDLYEVVAPDIKGWKLNDNSPNLYRDKYKEGNTTVTFKYDKDDTDPVIKSTITVKYVDEKGTEIQKSTSKQGNSGDKFQMSAKELEIKGYDLKSKAIDTTFGDKDKTITVEYTKHVDPVKQGSVTFKYVDKDSKELQASKTVKGDVDKAFEEKAPTIEGYSLDKSKSDETYSGKFTEKGQTYYFVYNKDVTPTPDPQPEDSKLRPVLEQTIKDAKPYSDKAKYQAKYVDALDKAISDAEAFLKANPAPNAKARALKADSTDLDSKFQAQIDNVTTAVNNVTANPVTPTPDEDIVKITFNLYDMNDKDKDGNLKLLKTVVLDASKKEIDANGGLWDATKHKDELAVDGYTYVSGLGTLMEIDTHGAPNEFPVLYAKNTPNPTPDPVKQGSVTFKYVDKDSKELQASKTIKGDVGKAFEEKAPSIKGYKLDTTKSEETYKGKYTELGQTYYFVYVGDGSTPSNDPSHKDDNNNTSDNNNTPSDNKDSNNESGKTVPPTAPKGSYYDDNGNLLNKDGVLIDSKGTPLTSDQSKNTLKVDNTKNKTGLPETGESSTLLMMLSGLGVLMASVLAFIVKRKPKRD